MLLMKIILISAFPASIVCGTCQFYEHTFHCIGITQDEFTYEIFRQKDYLDTNYVNDIIIEESNYSTIQQFPNIKLLLPGMDLNRLFIRKSFVKRIFSGAFSENALSTLDLSHNEIDDISFVCNTTNIDEIILSHNSISEVDINCLEHLSSVYLDNNRISVIKQPNDFVRIALLDLSYNQLEEYFEYNFTTNQLNISYNLITNVSLKDKSRLTIYGNNITSFNNADWFTVNVIYTNFIPIQAMYVTELFSVAGAFIGYLNSENIIKVVSSYPIVDFSNTSLTSISENYFKDLVMSEINLSYNNFGILDRSVFTNSYVTKIDLSFSKIKNITKEYFRGLSTSLETLHLTGNLLESIDDICQTANHLTTLDLSLNKINALFSTTLASCTSLRKLNLSKCLIDDMEPGTFSTTHLQLLDLSGNKLTLLKSYTFSNSNYFTDIDISDNLIQHIEEFAFFNLQYIESINLSRNKFKILESHTFSRLNVQNLYFEGNSIRYIKSEAFDSLSQLRLLNLSNIGITTLENDVFLSLPKLETIDLSNNDIIILENYTFGNLPVSNIYLHGNKIELIYSGAFHNLRNLQKLNLSDLRITRMSPYSFTGLNNLNFLDLRNNNISGIDDNVFSDVTVNNIYLNGISDAVHFDDSVKVTNLTLGANGVFEKRAIYSVFLRYLYIINSTIDLMSNDCLLGLYNLRELHFINTNVSMSERNCLNGLFSLLHLDASSIFKNADTLEENSFQDLNSLNSLKISNTNLTEIQDNAFYGLHKLQELYLDGNKIRLINSTTFDHLKNVTSLDLSYNHLTSINFTIIVESLSNLEFLNISSCLIRDIYVKNTSSQHSLQYLYASNNSITSLTADTFTLFQNLKILHLNDNRIQSFGFQIFMPTTNLNELRLDNNIIQGLSVGVFDGIERLVFLNISDNPSLYYSTNILTSIRNLKNLRTLYIDNTGITTFLFSNLHNDFPYLYRIGINNNRLGCSSLSDILRYFITYNIDYKPYNPVFNVQNIDGIICTNNNLLNIS